jgi:hypothetical protein
MDRHNELMRCHERIVQALTLEETIRGHSDMLNLLEVKLSCVRRSPIRDDHKAPMIDDVIGRMRHHRDAIDRRNSPTMETRHPTSDRSW